jgi:hypothetical protein
MWILHELYSDRVTRMAADLGVSGAAVSRIAGGKQQIGPRMIAALAAHPKINPDWIRHGVGEPLRSIVRQGSAQLTHQENSALPVSDQVLPGGARRHVLRLETAPRFPVAPEFHKAGRYWLRLSEPVPVLVPINKRESFLNGDLLLIESERRLWEESSDPINGRFCLVRLSLTAQANTYGLVEWGADFDFQGREFVFRTGVAVEAMHIHNQSMQSRGLDDFSENDDEEDEIPHAPAQFPTCLLPGDIIGAVVLLVRTWQ